MNDGDIVCGMLKTGTVVVGKYRAIDTTTGKFVLEKAAVLTQVFTGRQMMVQLASLYHPASETFPDVRSSEFSGVPLVEAAQPTRALYMKAVHGIEVVPGAQLEGLGAPPNPDGKLVT